jgi:hypothetical protein
MSERFVLSWWLWWIVIGRLMPLCYFLHGGVTHSRCPLPLEVDASLHRFLIQLQHWLICLLIKTRKKKKTSSFMTSILRDLTTLLTKLACTIDHDCSLTSRVAIYRSRQRLWRPIISLQMSQLSLRSDS